MKANPRRDVFKRGKKIDLPAPEYETVIDTLAEKHLVHVERYRYVLCVNSLDNDQQYLKDLTCSGRIRLRSDLDEDNHDYHCSDCGRTIFPRKKQKKEMLKLRPEKKAILEFVEATLNPLDVTVRQDPVGLFRLSGRGGEVHVAVADFCTERAVFNTGYPQLKSLVFVIGNERDYQRHLPPDVRCFHLLDLVDGSATSALHRELRRLLRLDDVKADTPAVLGIGATPPPAANSRMVQTDPYPDVVRIPNAKGTPWGQVKFYYVNGETLAIKVPGSRMARYSHIELGLANKRNKKPNKKWVLIEKLCEKNGTCDCNDLKQSFSAFTTLVSEMRSLLQMIFSIDSDPFSWCTRADGLRAAFQAFPDLPDDLYVGEDKWGTE